MSGNQDIRSRADGEISDVHDAKRGMDVHHGLSGDRRVSVERADHSRIVAYRGGRGYVQRPYMFHGHEFAHRTYYFHGQAYDRFYRRYPYRGMYLEVYSPRIYYQPAFYGYVYNPWAAPVPYAWGFVGTPWYGYYGGYFAPATMYATPALWLTDYMVSDALQQGYQARVDGGLPMEPVIAPTPLSPDVKAQIADEVKRQIALENAEAMGNAQHQGADPLSSGIARMLADGTPHVFVVGQNLDLVDTTGKECVVTPGDVLQLLPTAPTATSANLTVRASKGGQECAKATNVTVSLNDLQEMQNYMRETIDQGLGDMQSGKAKGLPSEPASVAKSLVATADFAVGAPPPEPNCATEIAQQAEEGDAREFQAGRAQPSAPGPSDQTNGSAAHGSTASRPTTPRLTTGRPTMSGVRMGGLDAAALIGPKAGAPSSTSQVDSVIKLVKAGLSEGLIIKSIQNNNRPIDLTTEDVVKLKAANVSENIVAVMRDPTVAVTSAPPLPLAAGAAAPLSGLPEPVANVNRTTSSTEGWRAAIQTRLEQQFPLTQLSGDKTDILTAGAVLVLKKSALAMYTSSSFSYLNTYINGQISNGLFGKLCKSAHQSSCRMFVRGEKFWVIGVEIKDDGAILRFLSDPLPDARYSGALKIPFTKGTTPAPDQIAATVSEVLGVDNPQAQPAQTAPQTFSKPPPPADSPAEVSLGQDMDQVVAVLGRPDRIATIGAKMIYSYKDLKVTFVNGKVTDIQ